MTLSFLSHLFKIKKMITDPNDPINTTIESKNHGDLVETYTNHYGLTKREYFAAMAMQAIINRAPDGQLGNAREGISYATHWADALIVELNK